jgi:hypothetical protein
MLIRLQAVEWQIGKGITFDDFFGRLQSVFEKSIATEKPIRFREKERLAWTQKHKDYWIMMLLSQRDHRRWVQIKRAKGKRPEIVIPAVEDDTAAADFNYLVLNPQSGRGVYSQYHHSCSFEDFTKLCRPIYRELKTDRIAAAVQAGDSENKALAKFAGGLHGTPLLTPKQLKALIEELKHIKRLELSFGEVQVKKSWGRPLEGIVTTAKHVFSFNQKTPIRRLRDQVSDAIFSSKATRGRVVGETENGLERTYNLSRNAGTFAEMDFDDTVEILDFDVADMSKSVVVVEMLKEVDSRPGYFKTPRELSSIKD